jgi:guanine nucleotide-binding protein G(i) subunit alpha
MIDCGGNLSTGKKWVHQFEGVTSVLFVVDLSSYDQVLPGDSFKNRVVEALELFESVINCRWFLRSSIILLLNNFERFKQKLVTRPLRDYFCDYSGGNDINRTAKYILSRFNQVNRAHQNLFSHLTEVTDMSYARFVLAAIKQTMLQQALSNIGRL